MVHIPGWSGQSKQITTPQPQPQTKSFNGNVLPGLFASAKFTYDGFIGAWALWKMHKDDQTNLAAFSASAAPVVGTPVQFTEEEKAIAARPEYSGVSDRSMQSVIQGHRRNAQNKTGAMAEVADFDSMSARTSIASGTHEAPDAGVDEAPKRTLPKGRLLAAQVTLCAVQILGGSAGMAHGARRLWN